MYICYMPIHMAILLRAAYTLHALPSSLHMHCTPQPALALSHQPKTYTLHHLHTRYHATHTYYIRRPMHTHASMPVYNKLHHITVSVQSFSASEGEVSLGACTSIFETSSQAQTKVQIHTSSLAVKHCSRSVASSTLAVKTARFHCECA